MRKFGVYELAAAGLLLWMVGFGFGAGKLRVPFATDSETIKLWIVGAMGIAMLGVMVWRIGGEVLLALVRGGWRDLRLYERDPVVEETYESERPFEEIVADVGERLAGLNFVVEKPMEAGEGVRIVGEKAKIREASGMFFNAMGAEIELLPEGARVRVRAELTLRTVCLGDVAADRRKMRAVARYVTGESGELGVITRPAVALDMAMVEVGMLAVMLALGKTTGHWAALGEVGQLCAMLLAGFGMLQIVRNRQTTTGMAAAVAVLMAGAWPVVVHGVGRWWPGGAVETEVQVVYGAAGLVGMGVLGWWWSGRMKVAPMVVQVPVGRAVAKRSVWSGWQVRVLLIGGLFGLILTVIGAGLVIETLGMREREEVSAEELAEGKRPRSGWVRLRGEMDWENAVWVGSGSGKEYFVPVWPVKGDARRAIGFVRLEVEAMTAEGKRRVSREGADGIVMAGGLPERALVELEKEGVEMGEEEVVVIDGRMPWDLRREAGWLTAAGAVIFAGVVMVWRRRLKKSADVNKEAPAMAPGL